MVKRGGNECHSQGHETQTSRLERAASPESHLSRDHSGGNEGDECLIVCLESRLTAILQSQVLVEKELDTLATSDYDVHSQKLPRVIIGASKTYWFT